jgi:aminoglycoside phosphotransferase (APT) family kinase protein
MTAVADHGPLVAALAGCLAPELGGPPRIEGLRPLVGGASREILAFDAVRHGERVPLVVSRPLPGPGRPMTVAGELAVLRAARCGGVPTPRPYAELPAGDHGLGGLVVERVNAEALPRRILREPAYVAARTTLVAETAAAAARLHALTPEDAGLPTPAGTPAEWAIGEIERAIDAVGEPHPALEVGLRRLRRDPPPATRPVTLVHGDLRLGNLLVDGAGLRALLDWELSHVGDAAEDLGWLCARSWRFGNDDRPALGLGTRDELLAAYAAAGGRHITRDELRWWEALANARWASMCLLQTVRFLVGETGSLELAAIGRRACEAEWDLLALLS